MQQGSFDPALIGKLDANLEEEHQRDDQQLRSRESASRRISMTMQGIARKKVSAEGTVEMFGSFSNGFKTGSSDLDVVFLCNKVGPESAIGLLDKFAQHVQQLGFENVTKIFSANVPLVKFTDSRSLMEVDFCINNELGVRNSKLLHAYCDYDERVLTLGRLVKDWAKRHELVGSTDGCLNSYAYMLMVIYFLQNTEPPVVPNLQQLAKEEVMVVDQKWGCEDHWDTKFVEDVKSLEPSANTSTVAELLLCFFRFYTAIFDWRHHAVCMRLSAPVEKVKLKTAISGEQWYVEDPFDLKHNLAGKCTNAGRSRIMAAMRESLRILEEGGAWADVCPASKNDKFFMKCRISHGVTTSDLLEEFLPFNLVSLHFLKPDESGRRMAQAFLEFSSAQDRRRAHTRNESYVNDCQLQLHYSSQHGLKEAMEQAEHSQQGSFYTIDTASYKMQKEVIRLQQIPQSPPDAIRQRSDMGRTPYDNSNFWGMNMMAVGYGGPPPPMMRNQGRMPQQNTPSWEQPQQQQHMPSSRPENVPPLQMQQQRERRDNAAPAQQQPRNQDREGLLQQPQPMSSPKRLAVQVSPDLAPPSVAGSAPPAPRKVPLPEQPPPANKSKPPPPLPTQSAEEPAREKAAGNEQTLLVPVQNLMSRSLSEILTQEQVSSFQGLLSTWRQPVHKREQAAAAAAAGAPPAAKTEVALKAEVWSKPGEELLFSKEQPQKSPGSAVSGLRGSGTEPVAQPKQRWNRRALYRERTGPSEIARPGATR